LFIFFKVSCDVDFRINYIFYILKIFDPFR